MTRVRVPKNKPIRRRAAALLAAAILVAGTARAQDADTAPDSGALPPVPAPGATAGALDRPAPDEVLRDLAGMLSPAQTRQLRKALHALRDDTGVPVYALVLDQIPPAQSGAAAAVGAPLAGFLQRLFVRMSDRHPLLQDADWSTGVVLALAPAQRRARVGFGPGWNDQTRRLAADLAPTFGAPAFRRGRYAQGLNQLVEVTGVLIRGQALPPAPGALWWRVLWISGAAVVGLAGLGVWHRPTRHRTLSVVRTLLALPHAALNRAAGRGADHAPRVYPLPPAGASSRW